MATITKLKSGNWQAKVRRKGIRKSKVFPTKSRAETWARRLETEADALGGNTHLLQARLRAETLTLSDALDKYLTEIAAAKASYQADQSRAKSIKTQSFSTLPLASIQPAHIKTFFDIELTQIRHLSPSSIQKYHALISRVFNVARTAWGMTTLVNPCQHVAKPAIHNARERRFTGDEQARLIAACKQPWKNKNRFLLPAILFALETTQRLGEILALHWCDVDIPGRKIKSHNKDTTGRQRYTVKHIPLSTRAIAVLNELKKHPDFDPEKPVFATTDEAIRQAFKKACKRACEHVYTYTPGQKRCTCLGIEDFHFHDLRHEAISRLFENTTLRTEQIMTITGHRTYAMLQRYTHLRDTGEMADALG